MRAVCSGTGGIGCCGWSDMAKPPEITAPTPLSTLRLTHSPTVSGPKWDSLVGASFRPAHFFVAITFNSHAPDSEVLEHGDSEVWHRACLAVVALFGRSSLDLGRPQGWPLFCVIPVFDPRPR